MDRQTLANYLDFANHHQDVTLEGVKSLCQQVKKDGFHSAFVNPCYVGLARKFLPEGIIGTAISFPLGQDHKDIKVLAVIKAVKDGADELDIPMNVGFFKADQSEAVLEEMEAIIGAAKNIKQNVIIKFIIETGLLNEKEIQEASQLVLQSGADFVKTNSGWGPRGASLKDVDLIKKAVGGKIKIKVAGGVDTYQEAIAFINRGVDRIGTSHAVEIMRDFKKRRGGDDQ